ncbi:MAG: YjgB family protein [Alicyclobacillus sp.]|nr:YjgB family protein [Alicyclobacillus sp.]
MKPAATLMASAALALCTGGVAGAMTRTAFAKSNSQTATEIKAIYQAALHGRALGIPYVSGKTNISGIQQAWGKPNREDAAGAGMYDTFSHHQAAFGYNKGGQLFDVRSFATSLNAITEKPVEQVLGMPGAVHHYAGEPIFLYPAGPDYQLLWVFTAPTKSHPIPHLDHISVFNPQASVNSMAATGPAPTPTIDIAPGAVGHLFTFSIPKPQAGYAVAEFEWISRNGQSVVNTMDQALRNGATGKAPGFEVSGDGQTLSFHYTSSLVGQTGYELLNKTQVAER